ncbi:hypothetical protein [uncultured Fibrella sp.]|uniref:hypothetical protein n=1 Tax=uncultured Fibrella sp. TaxID=1284596 RepID=UPI0035CC82FA
MKRILIGSSWLLSTVFSFGQQPTVTSGTLIRYAGFASKFVEARNVDIWLPAGYLASKK